MFSPHYSMFFDLHTMQACPDVGHAFDAEAFAEQLKDAGTPIRSVYNSFAFPYLNPENLRRWSRYFDEMETLAAGNPDALYHVKLARISVDAAYITVTADSDSWPQTEHRIGLLEKRIQQLHEKYHYSFTMDGKAFSYEYVQKDSVPVSLTLSIDGTKEYEYVWPPPPSPPPA